jgi:ribosomal protein S18 acetylase RimI-like enzyme
MITFEWSDWHNRQYYWIQSLYVRPEYRRQGIFRKLYDYVHSLASEDGAAIRLYVDENNSTAQSVYQAVGMKESHYKLYEKHFLL